MVFPVDSEDRPTFRPSAAWYQEQFEFTNTISSHRQNLDIHIEGADIHLKSRCNFRTVCRTVCPPLGLVVGLLTPRPLISDGRLYSTKNSNSRTFLRIRKPSR